MEASPRLDGDGRLAALADLLQREGRVEVARVASTLGAAEMTIRRDLDRMVAMGLAQRVRGGAISLLMRGEEPPFAMRAVERAEAKRRIGTTVAALLRDGEAVILDSGSTAVEVGRALAGRRLTVMPMSLHAVGVLSAGVAPRLLIPGGEARPAELSLVGPLALASIGALRFDTAVLSCCGLADGRVTAHDLGDAEVKQAMLRSSARVVLAADGSKFRRTALAVVCAASAVDTVVTDTAAPDDAVEALRADGVEVRCVLCAPCLRRPVSEATCV
jgi:DeoR/GlpR family transcriptional regulator of sugar metabolism